MTVTNTGRIEPGGPSEGRKLRGRSEGSSDRARGLRIFVVLWVLVTFGAMLAVVLFGVGAPGDAPASWLQEHPTKEVSRVRPAPSTRGLRMPNFRLSTLEGGTRKLWEEEAPAVVTEWLAFCPDCRSSAALFPTFAEKVVGAGEEIVNVAFMGRRDVVTKYLESRDFGGVTLLDDQGVMQRHYGIGTFTVWLLDRDGTIRFQGSVEEALPLLEGHLEARRSQPTREPAEAMQR